MTAKIDHRKGSRRAADAYDLTPDQQDRLVAQLGQRAASRIIALSERHHWGFGEFADVYELVAQAFEDGRQPWFVG